VLSSLLPAWHWQALPRLPFIEQQGAASAETPTPTAVFDESTTGSAELALPPPGASATAQPENSMSGPPVARSRVAPNWPQLLTMVWLLGAAAGALRLLVSRSRFAVLVNKAAPVDDPSWSLQIKKISYLLRIRRSVELLESKDTEVPLTTGAFRPKVILSPDYNEWSPLRRDAILHHELAHIRRWDILAQTLCQIAIAMYWFHPLVWLTVRAMRAEREQACDDHVLAAGTRPSEYAHELLEIASSLRQPEFTAALAMARRSQLEGRVMALLNPMQRRGSISRRTTLAIAVLTFCAVLPLAAIQSAPPRDKRTEQRKPAIPAPAQNALSPEPDANTPPEPPEPEPPQAVPAPPADVAIAPPVDDKPGAIAGGVRGGVEGGIQGGIRNGVRNVPPMPPAPGSVPAPPQAASPAVAPLPPIPPVGGIQKPPAIPKAPRVAPASPQPVPAPAPEPKAAPVAPRVVPAPQPGAVVTPAPKPNPAPRAASAAPQSSALQAHVAAIVAQATADPQEIKALQAKTAAIAARVSSSAPEAARLRVEAAAVAAQAGSMSHELNTLQSEVAALAASTRQATASPEVAAVRAQIAAIQATVASTAHQVAARAQHAAAASVDCNPHSGHPQSTESNNDGHRKR